MSKIEVVFGVPVITERSNTTATLNGVILERDSTWHNLYNLIHEGGRYTFCQNVGVSSGETIDETQKEFQVRVWRTFIDFATNDIDTSEETLFCIKEDSSYLQVYNCYQFIGGEITTYTAVEMGVPISAIVIESQASKAVILNLYRDSVK